MRRLVLLLVGLTALAAGALGVHLVRTLPAGEPVLEAFRSSVGLAAPPPGASGAWLLDALADARRDAALVVLAGLVLTATVLAAVAPAASRGLRTSVLFVVGYLVTLPISGALIAAAQVEAYRWTRTLALFCMGVTLVNLFSVAVWDVVVRLTRVPSRPILRDLITGFAYAVMTIVVLSKAGLPLRELLPAGAVATGLVGLAIQSTLADVAGGLLLEWEDSIEVDDWIRVGDVTGIVREIRWRHTRVETRNWESVLLPNSLITKSNVVVLGRTDGRPLQLRRWVYFTVGFEHRPAAVIALVDAALQSSPIERVAAEPRPHCILFDFREAGNYYAARYWLTAIAVDDPTDSAVRVRIHTALCRAGIDLAIPSRDVRMTVDDEQARARSAASEKDSRLGVLRRFRLFDMLTEDEMMRLVPHLSHVPFARGEVMTRQGAEAHWLYLVVKGQASVKLQAPSGETKVVARLEDGDYFGEIALFTGERRSATVIADTDCECWRLERQGFKDVVQARPEIASELSRIIAARRVGIEAALAQTGPAPNLAAEQRRVFQEISRFFGLSG